MKKIILLLAILHQLNNLSMAQQILLTTNGLDSFEIGSILKLNSLNNIERAEKYSNLQSIRFGLKERYNYFFFKADSISIPKIGVVKDIFLVTDKNNKILSIFIFLKSEYADILSSINDIFGLPRVEGSSGIGETVTSRALKLWASQNVLLHYRKNNKNVTKLLIENIDKKDDLYNVVYKDN